MIGWIAEHFSITPAWTTFDVPVQFSLVGCHYTAWPDYYEVELTLAGLGFAFGYWPNGKYDVSDGAGA